MRKWLSLTLITLLSVTVILSACAAPEAELKKAEEFYQGARIDLIVPYKPGGGFDAYARILAPFLGPILGAKEVHVENKTGGGGYTAANWMYQSAPRDGKTIAIINGQTLVVNELFQRVEVAKFPSMKVFSVIGGWSGTHQLITVSPKLPYKSLDELKGAKGLKAGTTDPVGTHAISAAVAAEALGLQDFKIVAGYGGNAELMAALAKGELDIHFDSWETAKKAVDKGFSKAVGILSGERVAAYPDLKTVYEIGMPSGAKKWVEVMNATRGCLRLFVAPPETPKDRVKFLSQAFFKTIESEEFKQAVEKRGRLIFSPGDASEMLGRIDTVLGMSDKDKEEFKNMVGKKYYR